MIEYVKISGQYQVLETLKQRAKDLKDEELVIKRKFDFYEYMKDEAKVKEKRKKIKSIPNLLEKLNSQKSVLTEKSRQLVNQINQISKSMVGLVYQDYFRSYEL